MANRSLVLDGVLVVLAAAAVTFMGLSYFRNRPAAAVAPSSIASDDRYIGKALSIASPRADTSAAQGPAASATHCPQLVVFFRSDCPYCEVTAPEWTRIFRETHLASLVVVNAESRDIARSWLLSHNLPTAGLLAADESIELAETWNVTHVPMTVVTDAAGIVTYAHTGVLDHQAAAQVTQALKNVTGGNCLASSPAS